MSAPASLAPRASRGAFVTMGGQGIRLAIQLAGIVVLARLLDPSDYGLLAMVLAIIGIGELLRDFGLSAAAVQAPDLSSRQRDNLFWISTLVGGGLAVAVALSAPLIALIYSEPRLQGLALVLSITFLLNGVASQFRAGYVRTLRFGRIAVSDTSAQAVGLAVGVGMAVAGLGYWALAGQQVAIALITVLTLVVGAGWRPGRYTRGTPMRSLLGFGGNLFGSQLLGYASKNVDSVVLGIALGPAALGLYNRAFQLSMLPLTQINAPATNVALGVLSRLQDESERYRRYLLAGQTALLAVVLSIFSIGIPLAGPLFEAILGEEWAGAAPIFQILAVAGIFHTAGYTTYWVFLSRGLTRSHLYFELISRPPFIAAVLFGAIWGVVGVAVAYSGATVLMWVAGLFWIRRAAGAPSGAIAANVVKGLLAYGLCGLAAFGAAQLVSGSAWLMLLLGAGTWGCAWLLLFTLVPPLRADVRTMRTIAGNLRGGTRAPAVATNVAV